MSLDAAGVWSPLRESLGIYLAHQRARFERANRPRCAWCQRGLDGGAFVHPVGILCFECVPRVMQALRSAFDELGEHFAADPAGVDGVTELEAATASAAAGGSSSDECSGKASGISSDPALAGGCAPRASLLPPGAFFLGA